MQPWVTQFPESIAALDASGYTWESAPLDPEDDEAYYRLIADLWHSGEDFCLVEQDNVPAPGILREFEECP